jgi:hypothetical protein
MAIISQNAIKSGFFVISGRNSREIEGEFHYYLKKQSQFETPVPKEAAGMRGCRGPLRSGGRRKTLATQKA